jgi:hypothetical protein
MRSLIYCAFQTRKPECFNLLLRHGSDLFVSDANYLPLAHTIYNLPIQQKNPCKDALIIYLMENHAFHKHFFTKLCKIVSKRLELDNTLNPEMRESMNKSLELYKISSSGGGNGFISPESARQSLEISSYINAETLESIKSDPSYLARVKNIQELNKDYNIIIKKKRLSTKYSYALTKNLSDLNKIISDNEYLQEKLKTVSIDDFLEMMDSDIESLKDDIFLLDKSCMPIRDRKEIALYNDVKARVEKRQNMRSQAGNICSINKVLSEMQKLRASLETWTNNSKDFLKALEKNSIFATKDDSDSEHLLLEATSSLQEDEGGCDEYPEI